jgi:hypothetical protein
MRYLLHQNYPVLPLPAAAEAGEAAPSPAAAAAANPAAAPSQNFHDRTAAARDEGTG